MKTVYVEMPQCVTLILEISKKKNEKMRNETYFHLKKSHYVYKILWTTLLVIIVL